MISRLNEYKVLVSLYMERDWPQLEKNLEFFSKKSPEFLLIQIRKLLLEKKYSKFEKVSELTQSIIESDSEDKILQHHFTADLNFTIGRYRYMVEDSSAKFFELAKQHYALAKNHDLECRARLNLVLSLMDEDKLVEAMHEVSQLERLSSDVLVSKQLKVFKLRLLLLQGKYKEAVGQKLAPPSNHVTDIKAYLHYIDAHLSLGFELNAKKLLAMLEAVVSNTDPDIIATIRFLHARLDKFSATIEFSMEDVNLVLESFRSKAAFLLCLKEQILPPAKLRDDAEVQLWLRSKIPLIPEMNLGASVNVYREINLESKTISENGEISKLPISPKSQAWKLISSFKEKQRLSTEDLISSVLESEPVSQEDWSKAKQQIRVVVRRTNTKFPEEILAKDGDLWVLDKSLKVS